MTTDVHETLPLVERLYTDLRNVTHQQSVACDVRIAAGGKGLIFNVRWPQAGEECEVLHTHAGKLDQAVIDELVSKVRARVFSASSALQ